MKKPDARRPIVGAEKLLGLLTFVHHAEHVSGSVLWLNGQPAIRMDLDGATVAISVVIENGKVTRLYAVNNPHKLQRLETIAEVHR